LRVRSITIRSLHGVKVPVSSEDTHTRAHFTPQRWLLCHMGLYKFEFEFEEKNDSASSIPAPCRRSDPSAKTAGNSVHLNFLSSRLSIIQLPCVSSTAPPALGKAEFIR